MPLMRTHSRAGWQAFIVLWLVLASVPAVPIYHGKFLGAVVAPAIVYLGFASGASLPALFTFGACVAGHLLAAWLLAAATVAAQRRFSPTTSRCLAFASVAVYVAGGAWVAFECRSRGLFADDGGVYHDVSAHVRPSGGGSGQFADAQEVADYLAHRMANHGAGYGPHIAFGVERDLTVIATGTWPQHWRLRNELEAMKRE